MGGRGEVRAAHFLDLGPIVSLEWVNIDISNLVHRLYMARSNNR